MFSILIDRLKWIPGAVPRRMVPAGTAKHKPGLSRVALMSVALVAVGLQAGLVCVYAQSASDLMTMTVGDSQVIEGKNIKRTAISDPVVADVVALSTGEILVNAKSPGKAVIYIWDAAGRRSRRIDVQPLQWDSAPMVERIKGELNDPRITVRAIGNTIFLDGTVSRESESSRAESLARAIAETVVFPGVSSGDKATETKTTSKPEGEGFVVEKVTNQKEGTVQVQSGLRTPRVVNNLQIEKPLGEVSVRTMEVSGAIRQALNNQALVVRALPNSVVVVEGKVGTKADLLAIDNLLAAWNKSGKDDKGGRDANGDTTETITIVNSVLVDTSLARQVLVRAQVVDIDKNALKDFGVDWGRVTFTNNNGIITRTVEDQPWLIGQTGLGPSDLFGGGGIQRFDPIGARVRALEQQNKAKVLSQPNLLAIDGEEANMLVGGEIPIPVVQSAGVGTAASVSVVYKEFGVRLKILPYITGANTVQLKVMPEVSSLDFANAVVFSGFVIPALRSRRAETTVNVRAGQSLLIGGLLQNSTSKLVKKIPVIGDLPIIGELFKTRSFTNEESELVIIITPQIVEPTSVNPSAAAPTAPGSPAAPAQPEVPSAAK